MAIEPGDELGAGRGHLRASHADREHVIGTLKAAFVQGMLTKDEFDLRAGQAFAARTYAELTAAITDIPPGLTTPKPPAPARAQGRQPVLQPGRVALAATMLYAGVWVYVILFPMGRDNDTDGELIIVGGFVYLIILAICVGRAAALLEKRSGGQLPQGPASARAVRPPSACHQPTRAGSFRQSIMVTSTPPKQRHGVFFARGCRARGHCADGVSARVSRLPGSLPLPDQLRHASQGASNQACPRRRRRVGCRYESRTRTGRHDCSDLHRRLETRLHPRYAESAVQVSSQCGVLTN